MGSSIVFCEVLNPETKGDICKFVLSQLPEWFGIPSAIDEYTYEVRDYKFWVAKDGEAIVGFAAVKVHNEYTAELAVIGVLKEVHRNGIGKELVRLAKQYCRESGCHYLTVFTLDDIDPYEPYARTRAFYRACGFHSLQPVKNYWNEDNPCLIMVMDL
jgi:ribosomal protein S18 acetylase RimI-like enzyme